MGYSYFFETRKGLITEKQLWNSKDPALIYSDYCLCNVKPSNPSIFPSTWSKNRQILSRAEQCYDMVKL